MDLSKHQYPIVFRFIFRSFTFLSLYSQNLVKQKGPYLTNIKTNWNIFKEMVKDKITHISVQQLCVNIQSAASWTSGLLASLDISIISHIQHIPPNIRHFVAEKRRLRKTKMADDISLTNVSKDLNRKNRSQCKNT